MSTRTVIAAAVTAATAFLFAVQIASLPSYAGANPALEVYAPCMVMVRSTLGARPNTGLQAGDVVMLSKMDPASRLLVGQDSMRAGESFSAIVMRGGKQAVIREVAPQPVAAMSWAPGLAVKIIIYLVGLLVLWRGRDARSLFFGIASLCVTIALLPVPFSILPISARAAYESIAFCMSSIAIVFMYLMMEDLARRFVSALLLRVTRTTVVLAAAAAIVYGVSYPATRMMSGCVPAWEKFLFPAATGVGLAMILAVLTAAYALARGDQRQRVRWVFWSTLVGFSGVFVWIITRGAAAGAVLTAVAIPLGYAYAILRHRVIDVTFVFNRAIVFTTITTAIFGGFAIIASLVERRTLAEGTGILLQAGLALALAFSFDYLYKRIESFVDNIFFRDRHRAELALRRLADEARNVRNRRTLLDRTVQTVQAALRARAVAIFDADGPAYRLVSKAADGAAPLAEEASVDDPAFIRMRTYLTEVDLSETPSALGAEGHAFPMAVQGTVAGALFIDRRDGDEPYDPRERELLRAVARETAAALQVIRAAEQTELLRAIADGQPADGAMRERARKLIESM